LDKIVIAGVTRQSILFREKMDARVEPGHDGGG
jgi:hypothetical protein